MSGTFEHTAHLTYVINNATVKQRSLHVTLLDLKNAFFEVNHNLLDCVFEYHHIPIKVRTLVRDLYTDFSTAIAFDAFMKDFILVGRWVLQGDCLSPLTFNIVINTFIQFVKKRNISSSVTISSNIWFQDTGTICWWCGSSNGIRTRKPSSTQRLQSLVYVGRYDNKSG